MKRIEFWLTSRLVGLKTFAVAGTLLIAANQPALARHDLSFRDFRTQNPELGRREVRQAFRAEFRDIRQASIESRSRSPRLETIPLIDTALLQPHAIGVARVDTPKVNNILRNRSAQVNANGQLLKLSSGIDLDLTSTARNISLGKSLFADGATVQINSGGQVKTVGAGSLVSAAEYVAVKQILAGEGQKINIDRGGRGVGGDVNLETIATDRTALRAASLVVPVNVTTSGDFGRHSEFRLLGDLNNYGTLQAYSSDSGRRAGTISAVDINNYKGASINSTVDLTLNASGSLNNAGTISSSGSLTLTAAGAVNNKGAVTAGGDINLQASTISNNKGTFESTGGNINLEGSSLALMNVDNHKGTLKALNGAINVRNSGYSGAFDSYVDGGDLFSQALNINSGEGIANVYVNELTGVVNQYGKAAHISATTENLNLGVTCLTGDPTIYNNGNINVTADILVAENLVLVASGDIIVADNVDIQAGNATRGFEMNFIAGASFTPTGGGSDTPEIPPLAGAGGVSVSPKASKTGGGIIMGTNVTVTSRATSLVGDTDGDGVLMVAFQGKTANAGKVDVSGATITTGGSGTGANGSVYILAAGTKGDVIKTGVIDTSGGDPDAGTEGNIGLFTVNIITKSKTFGPGGGPVVYDAAGVNISDFYFTGDKFSKSGNLIINDARVGSDLVGRSLDLYGGGLVSILGQGETYKFSVDTVSNNAITSGANGLLESAQTIFLIAPNAIGSSAQPIVTDAENVQSFLNGKGKDNYVRVVGSGNVQFQGLASGKGTISLDAPDRVVSAQNDFLSAGTVNIVADSLGFFDDVNAGFLSVDLLNGSFSNANFGTNVNATFVTLTAQNGGIGTDVSLLAVPNGAKNLFLDAGNGGIFINNNGTNALNIAAAFATGAITMFSNGNFTLAGDVSSGAGITNIQTSGASISINGSVSAKDYLSIVTTNDKGKIAIGKNVQITTEGTTPAHGSILISVGNNNIDPATQPIKNVVIDDQGTGAVTITGGGIKAKSPNNVLTILDSANIHINNGLKAGNLTMGGGVLITADN